MSEPQPFVIALDGPAAAGKSTVGLGVARRLRLGYFDTGLLYRALTLFALSRGLDTSDGEALAALIPELNITIDPIGHVLRDGADITESLHQNGVNAAVSAVSAHPEVREGMRPAQRRLITPPGLVMAGRDIGTVIVPEAQLKIWLSASPEERARRRAAQTGEPFETVLEGMRRRDQLDASREVAPMARADDAVSVDTDGLTPEQVIARIVQLATERGA
jgi:cytidylate kinase